MKRMLFSLAVLALAGAGSARADWGGYGPPVPNAGAPVQPIRQEFSAPNTLMGLGHNQPGRAPDRYGLLPGLRRAFRVGNDGCNGGCDTCGTAGRPGLFTHGGGHPGHPGYGGHPGNGGGYDPYAQQQPPVMQGTLVFPNHQFVRSPRDFFMYEPGR